MNSDLKNARILLDTQDVTCAVCRGDRSYTATERGVKPLLNWVDAGFELAGFSAADRVVGRATAFLYVLLRVREVYARVMSRPAVEVLQSHGIAASTDCLVDGIINRKGTGPCPFEAAVMDIADASGALAAIRKKMEQMQKGN